MRDPRHILITGASSGIGAALAIEYASPGIRLLLHGRQTERLTKIADEARRQGATVSTHTGDVTDATDLNAWILAQDKEAEIDLVIANAGISAGTSQGESATQVENIFATNVTGVFNTVHPALSLMQKRRRGQIAIVSSLASFRGFSGAPAYCASKAAVRVYGEGLRSAMASHNIEINIICPGFIKTPMTDVNRFRMPLLMEADRAAVLIRKGLAHNRARIAFPFALYMLVRLMGILPQVALDFIDARLPRK